MDAVQVVQEQVDAANARDLDRFVDCYSPDAVVKDGAGNVMVEGHDGIRGLYGKLFTQSPDLHVDIPRRIHVGSWVVDEERTTGFNFEGFPPEIHAAVVYHVEDGKIVSSTLLM